MGGKVRHLSGERDKKKLYRYTFWIKLFIILFACLTIIEPVLSIGQAYTIGDVILKTDQLRNLTGAEGTSIGVGVISNGAGGLIEAQSSGDLLRM